MQKIFVQHFSIFHPISFLPVSQFFVLFDNIPAKSPFYTGIFMHKSQKPHFYKNEVF